MHSQRSIIAILLCVLSVLVIIPGNFGCGGSKSSGTSDVQATTRGKMRLVIEWPTRTDTRLIPALTESIHITVYTVSSPTLLAEASVLRPPTQTQSEEIFEDLPPGEVRIEVSAEPATNNVSTGKLATGVTTATIRVGETTEANIVMSSTITRLAVIPELKRLFLGTTYQQAVRPEDSNGYLVLTLPQNITRQSDNESVVTIDANGLLTPRSLGTARITIRETESGVQTSYAVEVVNPDPRSEIPPMYEITDLGDPPTNLFIGEVCSVNDNSQVVGWFEEGPIQRPNNKRAFLWQNGVYTLLGVPVGQEYSAAYDINNRGQVVGGSKGVSWIWESGVLAPITLPPIPPLTVLNEAFGINESGEVVGRVIASDYIRIFRRSPEGIVSMIPAFAYSQPPVPRNTDINEAGDIVFPSSLPNQADTTDLLRRNGDRVALLPTNIPAIGRAVNDSGFVVGSAKFPGMGSNSRATYWSPGGTATMILPEDTWEPSIATDVNNGQLIIGYRTPGNNPIPFVARPGETSVLLSSRIPSNSGWVLWHANGINQQGQIVGIGSKGGRLRGFLLTPKF